MSYVRIFIHIILLGKDVYSFIILLGKDVYSFT